MSLFVRGVQSAESLQRAAQVQKGKERFNYLFGKNIECKLIVTLLTKLLYLYLVTLKEILKVTPNPTAK